MPVSVFARRLVLCLRGVWTVISSCPGGSPCSLARTPIRVYRGLDGACNRRDPSSGLRPLVVDVGAHVGWFSALAASYGCRVLSFEPQPHAHPFINATITLNGWEDRWRSVWGAVSSGEAGGPRMKMVNRHGWDNWDVAELVPLEDPDDGDEVPVWRLDDWVREDVALLKIDAEGHEDYVVSSAASLLASYNVAAILVEAKGGGGDDRDAFKREWFANLTERQGYTPYEFYEEVGRSVYSWDLAEHLFPIHVTRSWTAWPGNQVFEDHLFSRALLALPLPGTVSVQVNVHEAGACRSAGPTVTLDVCTGNQVQPCLVECLCVCACSILRWIMYSRTRPR